MRSGVALHSAENLATQQKNIFHHRPVNAERSLLLWCFSVPYSACICGSQPPSYPACMCGSCVCAKVSQHFHIRRVCAEVVHVRKSANTFCKAYLCRLPPSQPKRIENRDIAVWLLEISVAALWIQFPLLHGGALFPARAYHATTPRTPQSPTWQLLTLH